MNVESDGHLSLREYNLVPERRHVKEPALDDFEPDARIAAAYANQAGYKVTFVRAGQPAIVLAGETRYLMPRPLKKDGWPRKRRAAS
jgi:hypothetical protein